MTAEPLPVRSGQLEVDVTAAAGDFSVTAAFSAATGITVLFGPSGSGKSVTLDTIAGLLRPTTGTISVDGEIWADPEAGRHVRTQQRRLGMVAQRAALLAHRSPLDNVALGVRTGTRNDRRAAAQHWLERVHAGHLGASPTMSLSGGEQQRVALARALAGGPRLLLLDEPFSALDQPTRQALRALLRDLVADEGITALVVTHDLDDVVALADHVVVYEPGRTVATHELGPGSAHELATLLGLVQREAGPPAH